MNRTTFSDHSVAIMAETLAETLSETWKVVIPIEDVEEMVMEVLEAGLANEERLWHQAGVEMAESFHRDGHMNVVAILDRLGLKYGERSA